MPKILLLLVVALAAGTQATICANDADFDMLATATHSASSTSMTCFLDVGLFGSQSAHALAASDAEACEMTITANTGATMMVGRW